MRASMRILHEGGTTHPTVTPKARRFFWAMHYEAAEQGTDDVAEQWMAMALTRKTRLDVKIPARPWTHLSSGQWRTLNRVAQSEWNKILAEYQRTGRLR